VVHNITIREALIQEIEEGLAEVEAEDVLAKEVESQ
jgi:hypothetical protein